MENVVRSTQQALGEASREDHGPSSTILKRSEVRGKVTLFGRSHDVRLRAFLVDSVAGAGADFDAAFGEASETADLVYYSGHSGMGTNVTALAAKARVKKGHYQLLYLYGCETFAYIGQGMLDRRIAVHGSADDPKGTRHLDVVANALPVYGDDGKTLLGLQRALLAPDRPRSYRELLSEFAPRDLVVVFGDEDNAFRP